MDTAPFVLDVGIPTAKALPADGDVMIEGYAADFEEDRQGERFLPGAFDAALQKATKDEIPILDEHDNRRQLGVVEKLEVHDGKGLWIRGRIAAPTAEWAKDSVNKIQRGMKKGLSVRGLVKISQGMISALDLAEVSVTPVPVQPGALFAVSSKSLRYAAGFDDANDIAWAARGQVEEPDLATQKAAYAYIEARIEETRAALAEVATNLSQGTVE